MTAKTKKPATCNYLVPHARMVTGDDTMYGYFARDGEFPGGQPAPWAGYPCGGKTVKGSDRCHAHLGKEGPTS